MGLVARGTNMAFYKHVFSSFSVDNIGNPVISAATVPNTYRVSVYDKPTFTLSFWNSSGFVRVIPSDVKFETINEVGVIHNNYILI